MRIEIRARNTAVSDSLRAHVEDRFANVSKQVSALAQLEVELSEEKNPSIADNQVAEVTVRSKGPTLRVTGASSDMKASIDQLTEKLLRQVEHVRGKRRGRQARGNGIPPGGSMSIPADEEETGPQIVRTKQFSVKPMSAEEAALQLELIGHDFFVFRSDESGEINVLYRRRDGGYGLIEPQG